jgi:hypothetical protein
MALLVCPLFYVNPCVCYVCYRGQGGLLPWKEEAPAQVTHLQICVIRVTLTRGEYRAVHSAGQQHNFRGARSLETAAIERAGAVLVHDPVMFLLRSIQRLNTALQGWNGAA